MTIATVVAVGGGYGRWLDGWADGIVGQTRRPEQAALVDNGCDDPSAVGRAADKLAAVGVDVRTATLPWTHNYGRARNVAVDLTDTVWVSHVDADDVLMPHALADWAELEADADVVAFGWERLDGPPKTRIYRPSQGRTTLTSSAPASGLSPFRRSLWQEAPYRDCLTGGWDTALWRGFGWMAARFVPTRRPVFWYRWHPGSVFNSRVAAGDPAKVGARLGMLAKCPPSDVTVIVPWRDRGCEHRRSAWRWLRRRWQQRFPDWQLSEADCPGGWSKPAAVNAAVERADCRVLVVADADCIVDDDTLRWATLDAQVYPWVVPHGDVVRMDAKSTRLLLGAAPSADLPVRPSAYKRYRAYPGGGLLVVGRAQWDRMGGFDVRFSGWGAEDEAWAAAADTLLGPHVRYDADLLHLWHPPGARADHDGYSANRKLYGRYQAASGDPTAMRELVDA